MPNRSFACLTIIRAVLPAVHRDSELHVDGVRPDRRLAGCGGLRTATAAQPEASVSGAQSAERRVRAAAVHAVWRGGARPHREHRPAWQLVDLRRRCARPTVAALT